MGRLDLNHSPCVACPVLFHYTNGGNLSAVKPVIVTSQRLGSPHCERLALDLTAGDSRNAVLQAPT